MSERLNERCVLLAASYPSRDYESRSDSQEIAAAVKALIGAVFQREWKVVFGGHPTISPLILMIAREYGRKNSVTIYQSNYFVHHIGPATRQLVEEGFGQIKLVANDPLERPPEAGEKIDPTKCPRSLSAMRTQMMRHPNISGLVLIGGDSGLSEELNVFQSLLPNRPAIPIAAPGGVANALLESAHMPAIEHELRLALARSRNYLFLSTRILRYLDAQASR